MLYVTMLSSNATCTLLKCCNHACRWAGGNGSCAKLLTASYDGSVRLLDPATAMFELLVTDEEAEYSAMDCLADASSG